MKSEHQNARRALDHQLRDRPAASFPKIKFGISLRRRGGASLTAVVWPW